MSETTTTADSSRQSMIDNIHHAINHRYAHLDAQFIPDFCMQVKLRLATAGRSLLKSTPQTLIDILSEEDLLQEVSSSAGANKQFALNGISSAGSQYDFVLKAALGPGFISFWFRNQSNNLDKPLMQALDIIDRIYQRLEQLNLENSNGEAGKQDNTSGWDQSQTA